MLVDQAVGRHRIDQLDIVVELVDAAYAVALWSAFSAQHGFGPQKDRDAGFDRILVRWENCP